VRQVFAEVLKYRTADLDERTTFENFGVDSLISMTIVDRFERDLGELPATLLFEYQTLEKLADHLLEKRGGALPGGTEPAPAKPAPARTASGDIAVIAVSGRYPGAPDLDRFWRNLAAGTTSITEVPASRW